MTTINPYLTFSGNCEEAFNYYKTVFGGSFDNISRFAEMPPQEGVSLSEEDKTKIMHVSLPISAETVLMGSDTGGEWAPDIIVGNNFSLSVSVESIDKAKNIFNKLSAGGQVTMPLEKTFWSDAFGMCTDKFGINWMVSFSEPNQN
jgi:PhnB protein